MLGSSSLVASTTSASSALRGSRGRLAPARAPAAAGVAPRRAPALQRQRSACVGTAGAAAAAGTQLLALHLGDTTLQLPFSPAQARVLDEALAKLLQTFADKQAATRPKRWDMMEVRFSGPEAGEGIELVEVFCNPNAHASAFDAKLLVTVRGVGGLRVVSEGRLSAVKSDVDALLAGSS